MQINVSGNLNNSTGTDVVDGVFLISDGKNNKSFTFNYEETRFGSQVASAIISGKSLRFEFVPYHKQEYTSKILSALRFIYDEVLRPEVTKVLEGKRGTMIERDQQVVEGAQLNKSLEVEGKNMEAINFLLDTQEGSKEWLTG